MRLRHSVIVLAIVACGAAAYQYRLTRASQQEPPTAPKPQPSVKPSPRPVNPNQEINNRFVKQFSERIAGRENEPAGRVFKNIQLEWSKSVPAGRFLSIMNGGYARALGVSCTHCHVPMTRPRRSLLFAQSHQLGSRYRHGQRHVRRSPIINQGETLPNHGMLTATEVQPPFVRRDATR